MRGTITKALVLALVVLTAATAAASGKQEAAATAAPAQLKVLYGGGSLETMQIMEMAVKLWNQKFPRTVVELQMVPGSGYWDKFKVMMASKQLPDILRSDDDWVGEYFVRDQFMDLTDLVKRDIKTADFFADGWKPFMYKGKIYALPFKGDVVGMYYNNKLFKEAGVPDPKAGITYEQFLAACQKMTTQKDGRPYTYGFGIRTQWLYPQTWVWRAGGSLFDKGKTRSTLNEAASVAGLQAYTDLRNRYKVAPSASTEKEEGSETLFKAGRLAMWETGNWGLLAYRDSRKAGTLDFGVAMPVKGPANSLTRATYEGWSMPSYAQNKDAAWEVMKWLSTDKEPQVFLANIAALPIIKSIAYSEAFVRPDTPEDEQIFLTILEKTSRISEFLLQGAEVDAKWNRAVEGVFLGTKTAREAADAFVKDIQETIGNEIQYRPYADVDMATP
jgi:multiple sugar transport system substrate-binding protein